MTQTSTETLRLPRAAKWAMAVQAWLLRRNMMGPAGDELAVVTTIGRKSGKAHSTPIGYLRDGDAVIALNPRGSSNWLKNIVANPRVRLNLKGTDMRMRAEIITDESERRRLFELYKRDRARNFARLFGVPVTASAAELENALATRVLVIFKKTED